MTVKVYERILQLFEAEGIKTIFGIPDPNFVHMFVAAEKRGWNVVTPHHELAAGFMAEGYARMNGTPALCIATLGPGIANAAGAMMCAKVVLPKPGGPNSNTWSSASLRPRAALINISS